MEKHILCELVERGCSQREIASELGCSQSSVKHWLKKHQLQTKLLPHNKKLESRCKCGETDPDKFVKRGGERKCRSVCKDCHYRDRIERFRKKKLLAIEYKGGKCQRCGYNVCPGSLQFHHREPTQKDPNWKHVRSWSFKKMKVELDKCDLLCANCHGEEHWNGGLV